MFKASHSWGHSTLSGTTNGTLPCGEGERKPKSLGAGGHTGIHCNTHSCHGVNSDRIQGIYLDQGSTSGARAGVPSVSWTFCPANLNLVAYSGFSHSRIR
ncbi:hypothetical protein FKM82_029938 [Ascaphus truei]